MHSTIVSYTDCLKGLHRKTVSAHPVAQYLGARGARVLSNSFHDTDLLIGSDLLTNLQRIVASGKRQGFERMDLRISGDLIPYYLLVAGKLMVLERVVIDARENQGDVVFVIFYPEIIWQEASYWRAKARTQFHPNHLKDSDLEIVLRASSLPERTEEENRILRKALELSP